MQTSNPLLKKDCKTECNELLDILLQKCKHNKYLESRLIIHMRDILPNALSNELKVHKASEKRKIFLEKELQTFQTAFLATNGYCFLSTNGTFYLYDGFKYTNVKEDDIVYNLLSTVSYDNKSLIDWKHKTKISLLKKIKERSIFSVIPESKTIQYVLNLLTPTYFLTKNEAKYFLTCIGDNILKKNTGVTYYVTSIAKQNIIEMEKMCNVVTGIKNITSNFVSRYNDNVDLSDCRLIKMRNTQSLLDTWVEILRDNGLNILCVAAYYSNTHECGDNFLKKREELCEYALFLKNQTRENIVDKFVSEYIDDTKESMKHTHMSWKNMQYVWKLYLRELFIPNVVYGPTLKEILKNNFTYNVETDSFVGITSKHIPTISDFMIFWSNTIQTSTTNNDYEVDELATLFQKFVKDDKSLTCSTYGRIQEEEIISILTHYVPDIEIVGNKYILNIDCSLWNKTRDIEATVYIAREYFKENLKSCEDKTISFDDLYKYYLKHQIGEFIVSKAYFEKFIDNYLSQYIVYSRVISEKWIEEDSNEKEHAD